MTAPTVRPERRFTVPCTITVLHTMDSFEAHVELEGNIKTEIGDRILVHGASISVPYGETIKVQRTATVRRANMLEKLWIKIQAYFDLTELYEVSFSEGKL